MKLMIVNVRSFQVYVLIVDCHLIIIYHISRLKKSRKVCALARVTSGMSLSKKRTLMNMFFNSQFNYCPLIWMCHSRENNNKINKHHERNIKILATEMFAVSKSLARPQMHEIFKLKDQPQYSLRYNSLFSRPLVKLV